ncbi:hypothetical protein [Natronomonas sp. EA1]|uniref:hypothetical protein n=1 Tax=Natronomonas sp. EA1 TaxID=3421655 RepID=UPI003EBAF12E
MNVRDRVFGDRRGLALFLGALVLYGLYWRVDVFIVDTFALLNGLSSLAEGHLFLDRVRYGPVAGRKPGLYEAPGGVIARNYGQLLAALPVLVALKAIAAVASASALLVGLWSLVLAAFVRELGVLLDRPRLTRGAPVVGAVAFLVNLPGMTALPPAVLPLVALQLVTVLAAAMIPVLLYRLVSEFHGTRAGLLAGVFGLLVGPVGFWASIPKRHVITAALALATFLLFAASRRSGRTRDRALAYVPVGLTAWVSAPEGLALFVPLVAVDLLTARTNDPRSLATVAAVFGIAALPVLLTNAVLTGSPFVPPRMLASFSGLVETQAQAASAGAAPTQAATSGPTQATPTPEPTVASGESGGATPAPESTGSTGGLLTELVAGMLGLFEAAQRPLSVFVRLGEDGLHALDPTRLYHVLVRGGTIPGVDYAQTGGETLELTLLEAAPVLAGLTYLPVAGARRLARARGRYTFRGLREFREWVREPARATDLLAVTYVATFWLLYLPRLPLHATITVRYLVPTVPLLVYGLVRLPPVRGVARDGWREVGVIAAATTALVLAVIAFGLGPLGLSVGTLMQVHALSNLVIAGVVAGWLFTRPGDTRLGAVALGGALGAMAAFLLLSGVEYFGVGRTFLLPVGQTLEALLEVRG